MYKVFDEGVASVMDSLKSESHRRANRHYFKLLREYLTEHNLPYSHQSALSWLSENKDNWTAKKFSCCRTAAYKLNDFITNGEIHTHARQYPYEDAPKYAKLSIWGRHLLDSALQKTAYSGSAKNNFRIAVAEFLFFLEGLGITGSEEISMSCFVKYLSFMESEWQATDSRRSRIRYAGVFMSGLMEGNLSHILESWHGNSKIIQISTLPKNQRAIILEAVKNGKGNEVPLCDFYNCIMEQDTLLEQSGYSSESRRKYKSLWNSFCIFMLFNGLPYSPQLAGCWPAITGRRLPCLQDGGHFPQDETACIVSGTKHAAPESRIPQWSRDLLIQYLDSEKSCGKRESTINTTKYACLKFLLYLEEHNVTSCGGITPDVLKDFNIHDRHATPEGKKGYNSRIHRFLDYLGEQGLVPRTLHLALPCKMASQKRIVKILNESEIQQLYLARDAAETPLALRDSAVVFLGLRMGLRAGDIISLAFRDINWGAKTISITQNKTGRPLLLPMPVEVGNCIYQYIKYGRPKSGSKAVFLSHRPPYSELTSSACRAGLNRMLSPDGKDMGKHGFHITRRTFASRLLHAGNSADAIADLLGHDGNHTVMAYLSTDSPLMRMCAIPAGKVVGQL